MIMDLIWGLGLVLIIEGLAYVLAPRSVETMVQILSQMPVPQRRFIGALVALVGAIVLWGLRSFTT